MLCRRRRLCFPVEKLMNLCIEKIQLQWYCRDAILFVGTKLEMGSFFKRLREGKANDLQSNMWNVHRQIQMNGFLKKLWQAVENAPDDVKVAFKPVDMSPWCMLLLLSLYPCGII